MPALIELAQEGRPYPGFFVVQLVADGALGSGLIDGPHALQKRSAGGLDPDDLSPAVSGAGLAAHKAFCLQSIDQSRYVLGNQKALLDLDLMHRRQPSKKFQESVGSKSAQTSKIREAYGEILEDLY